jgi:hypothetical protein
MSWTKSNYLYGLFWALRNPGYGYDHYWGAKITQDCVYDTDRPLGIDWVSPTQFIEGTMIQRVTCGDKKYFEWSIVKQLTSDHYFRASFGWHLNSPLIAGEVRNLTATVSPWMKMQG